MGLNHGRSPPHLPQHPHDQLRLHMAPRLCVLRSLNTPRLASCHLRLASSNASISLDAVLYCSQLSLAPVVIPPVSC